MKIRVVPAAVGPPTFFPGPMLTAFYPLGCLAAYAKVHKDGMLRESFDFAPITPAPARVVEQALDRLLPEPGVVLLSCYVWNTASNMEFAAAVKRHSPQSLVVVGGPHIPRAPKHCKAFFDAHPYVDVAVRFEGELTLADLLETLARDKVDPGGLARADLGSVEGIAYRKNGELAQTKDRARARELGIFPSPYTSGEFDHWFERTEYMPFETNRGCPYGCTFCDWGSATLAKLSRMTMERVYGDIEYSARMRVYRIGMTDANFGILPRDVDIARYIVQMREKYGYPSAVGYTNAKVAKTRLTDIIKILRDAGLFVTGQISMQTTDEGVLRNVERANILTSEYEKMIAFFHQENIPTVSDMLLGLPGQTFETCRKDLQFFFDRKVGALIFAVSVMPNAPMADEEYRERFKIVVDEGGMVESTYSFDREEYARMFELCLAYKLFVKLGILRYLLYFAQIEHGVNAIDFIVRWLEVTAAEPERYPISVRVKNDLLGRDYQGGRKDWLVLNWNHEQAEFLFEAPEAFYREVLDVYRTGFGLELAGPDVDAILTANREVLPRVGRRVPTSVPLSRDVPGYFAELRSLPNVNGLPPDFAPLAKRGPGTLEITAEHQSVSYRFADLELTRGELELASNLRI